MSDMSIVPQLDMLGVGLTTTPPTLRDLGLEYPPKTTFQPYAVVLDDRTGSGKRVRRGFPRATWSFAVLTPAEMEVFTDLLDDAESVQVYVKTLRRDATYGVYVALMHITERAWGTNWQWDDVVVQFTRMILYFEEGY